MDKRLIVVLLGVFSCLLLACSPASNPIAPPLALRDNYSEVHDLCDLPLDQLSELRVLVVIPNTSSAIEPPKQQSYSTEIAPLRFRS